MISLSSSPCFFFLLSLLFPSLLEESAERERERERERVRGRGYQELRGPVGELCRVSRLKVGQRTNQLD